MNAMIIMANIIGYISHIITDKLSIEISLLETGGAKLDTFMY